MNLRIRSSLFISFLVLPSIVFAQTDSVRNEDQLMELLNNTPDKQGKHFTTGTFESTRIANGHSIENTQKGVLDFRVSHRFGYLNQGIQDFFGLDNATTRIHFDYGITDWLMVGLGRSSYMKEYDGFFKVRILRQQEEGGFPISISYMGAASVQTYKRPSDIPDSFNYYFTNRLAYVNQLLIARKITERLSLQLMPTQVHYNLVAYKKDKNDVFALGIGGRLKVSNRIALTAEYYYQLPDSKLHDVKDPSQKTKNPLTLGVDIETGGHVFQLLFTNAAGITERNVIGQTTGNWAKGDIHFGFNISRVFTIVRPKEFENSRNKIW